MSALALGPDVELHVEEQGTGRPILLLHGAGGPQSVVEAAAALALHGRVVAPTHPGFALTPRPDWLDRVDDLALLYLELLEREDLSDVLVVGFSVGGWIAAELAVRDSGRITGLVLVDAVGIRVGGCEDRDIADAFALSAQELAALSFHDPSNAPPDPASLSLEETTAIAANQEALAVYAWEPYMHDPKLRRRLRRVTAPALVVWGASDRIVSPEYGRAYADSLPDATFVLIEEAGHAPQLEQPQRLLELVLEFAHTTDAGRATGDLQEATP